MTASQHARHVTEQIARVMLALGRPVGIAELTEATGLAPRVIACRLAANTLGNMTPAYAWFVRGESGWSLTQRGREILSTGVAS